MATNSEKKDESKDGARTSASRIAAHAQEHINALTSRDVVGVTSVEPTDTGWLVQVEVLEDRRVPSSSDMLALYEAELDENGDLLAYRRTRRYVRGRADLGRD